MTATLDRSTTSPKNGIVWPLTRPTVFKVNETQNGVRDHHRNDESEAFLPLDQTLPQLLYELAVGLPALPEVHAFCVWLYQPENHSTRLHLLMAGLPAKLRAVEFPLDDSIADWVWQHQRLLIISPEAESRFPGFARRLLQSGIKSFCAIPLMVANRRIGVFGLASTKPEAFQNSNIESFPRGPAEMTSAIKNHNGLQNSSQLPKYHGGEVFCPESEASSGDNFEANYRAKCGDWGFV